VPFAFAVCSDLAALARAAVPIVATVARVAGVTQSIGDPSTALAGPERPSANLSLPGNDACTMRRSGAQQSRALRSLLTRTDLAYDRQPLKLPTYDACRSRHKLPTPLRTSRF
jgi:hypothetical protein